MELVTVSVIGLTMLALQGAFFFAIVYVAVRLAIRHERRTSSGDAQRI
jgi:hypothetical protein